MANFINERCLLTELCCAVQRIETSKKKVIFKFLGNPYTDIEQR